ncbi:MAG: helix-turn-helix domain-containing protein [Pseudomonadota bacterium]
MKQIATAIQESLPIEISNVAHGDLFKAETHWFHMFKSMIDSGDIAKIGPYATCVYIVIKAHTNFSNGRSFPSIETIAEKSGMSIAQVKRELRVLLESGYITKKLVGRKNNYTLREKVRINDENGTPQAVATWDYLPATVRHAVADLQNVLLSGEISGARIVHIERLQLNINNVSSGGININVEQLLTDIDKLPSNVKAVLKSAFTASRSKRT